MSDAKSNNPEPFSLEFAPIDTRRLKPPSSVFTLPDHMLIVIAQIVLTWSSFERDCEDLLTSLSRATQKPLPERWEMLSFPKRRKLLAMQAKLLFSKRPDVLKYLAGIWSDSVPIQRDRNTIVHGSVSLKIVTGLPVDGKITGAAYLVFKAIIRNKVLFKQFSMSELESVLYEIAHLKGRLGAITTNGPTLPFASLDKLFLQAFLEKDYRRFPIPTMPSDQPKSSPVK